MTLWHSYRGRAGVGLHTTEHHSYERFHIQRQKEEKQVLHEVLVHSYKKKPPPVRQPSLYLGRRQHYVHILGRAASVYVQRAPGPGPWGLQGAPGGPRGPGGAVGGLWGGCRGPGSTEVQRSWL